MGFFDQPTDARLARIERKLDMIIEHLGIEIPDHISPAIRQAIQDGRKIEAIKLYRDETGAGLREAKETIEAEL